MERVTWFLGMGERERRRDGVMAPELCAQGAEWAMKLENKVMSAAASTRTTGSGLVVVVEEEEGKEEDGDGEGRWRAWRGGEGGRGAEGSGIGHCALLARCAG